MLNKPVTALHAAVSLSPSDGERAAVRGAFILWLRNYLNRFREFTSRASLAMGRVVVSPHAGNGDHGDDFGESESMGGFPAKTASATDSSHTTNRVIKSLANAMPVT